MSKTPQQIVPDDEIERVHAHANFGSMGKRQVVNEGVLKAAFGYHSGSTQRAILLDHGLIRKLRDPYAEMVLTKKGKKYLQAVYGDKFGLIAAMGKPEPTP